MRLVVAFLATPPRNNAALGADETPSRQGDRSRIAEVAKRALAELK